MTVLLDLPFNTDEDGFSAGSYSASEGVDFANGRLEIAAGVTATRSFSAVSSGRVRIDFAFYVADTETAADTSKNTNLFILPTAGSVNTANSLFAFVISRSTADNASASKIRMRVNSAGTIVNVGPTTAELYGRSAWIKVAVDINFTADTYDFYINDIFWFRGVTVANTSAADISRIAIANNASAPTTYFDNFQVETNWAVPTETVLIDHNYVGGTGEIEDSLPDIDIRSVNPQPPKIADVSSYNSVNFGGFTLGADGAVPDAGSASPSRSSVAMYRCRPEGIAECEFKLSTTSTTAYMGLFHRVWAGMATDSYMNLRYFGNSANKFALFLNNTTLQSAASPTLSAGTIYTLKVEMRGRFIFCYYKQGSIGDATAYTQLFGGPHRLDSASTGSFGQLSEEHCGPFIVDVAANNIVRRFRFTGSIPADEKVITLGDHTYSLSYGSVRELYHAGSDEPDTNLFWSKGWQFGHRSQADMGNYKTYQATLVDETNVKAYRQRSLCLSPSAAYGYADCYVTFLRRGPWFADHLRPWHSVSDINFTPDHDFRPGKWSTTFRAVGPSGAGSSYTHTPGTTWTTRVTNNSGNKIPSGWQTLTSFGSDDVRMTQIMRNIQNATGVTNVITSKLEGNGDPFSIAFNFNNADITDNTDYIVARANLIESAAALDDTTLTQFRDDVGTPATLTFSIGAAKTDEAGDVDTDGFSERHGWYPITCSGGLAAWTLPVSSGKRFMPAFRLYGWDSGNTKVTIDGVEAVAGTDYVLDDLGDGSALLQDLSNRTADTDYTVEEPDAGEDPQTIDAAALSVTCTLVAPVIAAASPNSITHAPLAVNWSIVAPAITTGGGAQTITHSPLSVTYTLLAGSIASATSFTPADLSPSLWVRSHEDIYQDTARTIPADAAGDPVASWLDLFGGTNDLVQDTLDRQPVIAEDELDGFPAVHFNENYLETSDEVIAAEIWMVVNFVQKTSIGTLLSDSDSVGNNIRLEVGASPTQYRGNGNTNSDDFTHGGGALYVNGSETNTIPSGYHILRAVAASPTDAFTAAIGVDFAGTEAELDRPVNAKFVEIIVLPTLTTADEAEDLYEYLYGQYPSILIPTVILVPGEVFTIVNKPFTYTPRPAMSLASEVRNIEPGETRHVTVNYFQKLAVGELITEPPTVEQYEKETASAGDLTIDNESVNDSEVQLRNSNILAGQAVQFTVAAPADAEGQYVLKVTATTDGSPAQTFVDYLRIEATEAEEW